MNAIWQVLLALLAVVIAGPGWLTSAARLTPVGGGGGGPGYAVAPASGGRAHLNRT